MKFDLHGYILEEAKDAIFSSFRQMITQRDSQLEIIYGHLHGTRIRDYIDSSQFSSACDEEGIHILTKQRHSNGVFQLNPMAHRKISKNIYHPLQQTQK